MQNPGDEHGIVDVVPSTTDGTLVSNVANPSNPSQVGKFGFQSDAKAETNAGHDFYPGRKPLDVTPTPSVQPGTLDPSNWLEHAMEKPFYAGTDSYDKEKLGSKPFKVIDHMAANMTMITNHPSTDHNPMKGIFAGMEYANFSVRCKFAVEGKANIQNIAAMWLQWLSPDQFRTMSEDERTEMVETAFNTGGYSAMCEFGVKSSSAGFLEFGSATLDGAVRLGTRENNYLMQGTILIFTTTAPTFAVPGMIENGHNLFTIRKQLWITNFITSKQFAGAARMDAQRRAISHNHNTANGVIHAGNGHDTVPDSSNVSVGFGKVFSGGQMVALRNLIQSGKIIPDGWFNTKAPKAPLYHDMPIIKSANVSSEKGLGTFYIDNLETPSAFGIHLHEDLERVKESTHITFGAIPSNGRSDFKPAEFLKVDLMDTGSANYQPMQTKSRWHTLISITSSTLAPFFVEWLKRAIAANARIIVIVPTAKVTTAARTIAVNFLNDQITRGGSVLTWGTGDATNFESDWQYYLDNLQNKHEDDFTTLDKDVMSNLVNSSVFINPMKAKDPNDPYYHNNNGAAYMAINREKAGLSPDLRFQTISQAFEANVKQETVMTRTKQVAVDEYGEPKMQWVPVEGTMTDTDRKRFIGMLIAAIECVIAYLPAIVTTVEVIRDTVKYAKKATDKATDAWVLSSETASRNGAFNLSNTDIVYDDQTIVTSEGVKIPHLSEVTNANTVGIITSRNVPTPTKRQLQFEIEQFRKLTDKQT